MNKTREKLLKVIDLYCKYLKKRGIGPKSFPANHYFPTRTQILAHCHETLRMLKVGMRTETLTTETVRKEISTVQGCFFSEAVYTLEEITRHNKMD